jgi:hypothetical protein
MKVWIVALVILAAFMATVTQYQASEMYSWSTSDALYQVAVATVTAADWAQTRYISNNSTTCFEYNPIIGVHPSLGKVNDYFGATIATEALIAYGAPEIILLFGGSQIAVAKARTLAQGIFIGVESVAVSTNLRHGVKFNF